MVRYLAALALACLCARPAAAINHQIVVHEVLGSWQGDDTVQFVELRLLAAGEGFLSQGAELILDDASGSAETRRVFTFTHDVPNGASGATVLVGTNSLATVAGLTPDFVLPAGSLAPRAGRVCYRTNESLDCVAYGRFTGDNGPFGAPTPVTPDNRALQRVALAGSNRGDWASTLEPTPQNNADAFARLATLCGDGEINQGERCDGEQLGGATCRSLGFGSGTLRCRECHLDTSGCSPCGNGRLDAGEQCDGTELRGRTCASLGFTGGTLRCTERCRRATGDCDPTFYVPGGGPAGEPECLGEWQVTNAAGRPGASGKAPVRQSCRDGDAGCDADAVAGTCTFTVAVCLDHLDPRLGRSGGRPCRRTPVESWTLLAPDPAAGGADATIAGQLLAAVEALGSSTRTANGVVFAPPLDASERCTTPLGIVVPVGSPRLLRARVTAPIGRPRDSDKLKLVCLP